MTTIIVSFVLMAVLLVVAAVCASAETAIFSLSYHDRVKLRKEAPRAATAVNALLARPRELLVSLLFVNLMASTLYMVLTTIVALELESTAAKIVVSAFNLIVHTVLAEVVSKMLAARRRLEFCRWLAPSIRLALAWLGPLRTFLDRGLVAPLTRLFIGPGDRAATMTADDLAALLTVGASEGAIDRDEHRVLRQVVMLNGLRVRDVMTPRVNSPGLELEATEQDVMALAREHGLTRVAVWRQRDELAGVLDVKRFLVRSARMSRPRLAECLEAPHYVPDGASLDKLLGEIRTRGLKLAICVDEHGTITGMVTVADVVQRLIAEVVLDDEESGVALEVEMVGLGEWSVPGRLPARDWAEMFGLVPDLRVTTVSGLVFTRLGRLPRIGDVVRLGSLRVTVESLDGRMVGRARVKIESERAEKEGVA
ncbi:MAG: hemolysin family protein [Phycisphaerales bacterium]